MAARMQLLPRLAVLVALAVAQCEAAATDDPFAVPDGLLIGAGVSAIQTEGAWDADGKGESAADHLLHTGKLTKMGFSNDSHQHDTAADSYHRYKEDVHAAAALGLKLYRLSISWSRVLPDDVTRNEKGIKYYHDLIDEVIANGMTPLVTMYHFDHPWILEDKFKGWQSAEMIQHFKAYAKFLFDEYGKKVKMWITINEPNMYCTYFPGLFQAAEIYTDADMDHYACMRNAMLAHAEAYHIFKDGGYEGQVGCSVLLMTARANSTRPEDVYAAEAFNQMHAGVVLSPIVYGDYPEIVKAHASKQLKPFTDAEKTLITGSTDFIAFNIYYEMLASYSTASFNPFVHIPVIGPFLEDVPFVSMTVKGVDMQHMMSMYSVVEPDAMRTAVLWLWNQYKVPLLISENGFGDVSNLGTKDRIRGVYHSAFLRTLVTTMKEYSVKVLGYSTWSLIDSFEWSAGYGRPFGLVHVDYEGGSLNRTLKDSSKFWMELAETKRIPLWEEDKPSAAATAAASVSLLLLVLAANLL